MGKEMLAIGIIVWWICFGFAMTFLNPAFGNVYGDHFRKDVNDKGYVPVQNQNTGVLGAIDTFFGQVWNVVSALFDFVVLFVESMFLAIPNIPFAFTFVITCLNIVSLVYLVSFFRGG